MIPNRRYAWMLFEHPTDTDPVDIIILDVDLDEAIKIDRRVRKHLVPGNSNHETSHSAPVAPGGYLHD